MTGRWLDLLSTAGSARSWRRFHGVMALFWLVNNPAVGLLLLFGVGMRALVVYLIFVSLLTAWSGEMAALHGVTVQENQEQD